MLRMIGKMFGGAIAVLCVVSTLAMAVEMTCTASDGKGNCMEATGSDGHLVVVVGENLQTGHKMSCVDTGTVMHCAALVLQK